MEYNKRVFEFIEKEGITSSEFGKAIGATRQMVSNWKQASHPIPVKFLIRMINVYDLDARWLITGKDTGVSEKALAITEYESLVKSLKTEKMELQEKVNELDAKLLNEKDVVIKLKDEIIKMYQKK